MKHCLLPLLLTITLPFFSQAQSIKDKSKVTLFTLGGQKHNLEEFEYYFLKNSDKPTPDDASQEVNEYLRLYVDFRLKVQEALTLGMDKDPGFITELAGYKEQLIEPYLLTSKINEELIQETYGRMQTEVSGSHILLRTPPSATPEDTLEIYNRLLELKTRIENGEDFGKLAKEYSDDKSALQNNGYLGYFSALQMVYPFENAAFNNDIGDVVGPFSTQFGYHILRIEDKRPARGQALAAHIMIRHSGDDTSIANAKVKSQSIYENIKAGKDWDEQCRLYSDDKNTSENGGQLRWFGTGNLVPEFENVAFSLEKGEVSVPVITQFGWHIIKLIDRKPIPSLDEQRSTIEKRIARDSRSTTKKETALKRLKHAHHYKLDSSARTRAIAAFDSTLLNGSWKAPTNVDLRNSILFSTGDQRFSVGQFWQFVVSKQKARGSVTIDSYATLLLDQFVETSIFDLEKAHITNSNKQYKMILDEYQSGILLFNLMEQKVWNKAIEDTTGLKAFYENNSNRYQLDEHCMVRKIVVAHANMLDTIQSCLSFDKAKLDALFNKNNPLAVQITDHRILKGENEFLDQHWAIGTHIEKRVDSEVATIWEVKSINSKGVKPLKETRGLVISDYQSALEQEWLKELREKYPVKISKSAKKKYIATFESN